jgi:hypothetical protein
VAFQGIDVNGPEPAKWSQPRVDFLKWLRFKSVEAALSVDCGVHETSLSEHSQVLRHGWLWHTEVALDLPYRLL